MIVRRLTCGRILRTLASSRDRITAPYHFGDGLGFLRGGGWYRRRLDFDLGMGGDTKPVAPAAGPSTPAADSSGGLDFDLNLDGGTDKAAQSRGQRGGKARAAALSKKRGRRLAQSRCCQTMGEMKLDL